MSSKPVKLAAEDFLLPVHKFNASVGPLFAALRTRLPLKDEHTDSALARSLGIFLSHCYRDAITGLEAVRPSPVLLREEWTVAPDEVKRQHLHWQTNLKYLKQRNRHFVELIGLHSYGKEEEELA
jgi:hypothetical protein